MMLGQTGTTPAPSRASQGVAGGRLANISRGYCWTRGYPGISYVGLGNGTPIGRAATWDASAVTTITLAPRQHADAPLRMVNVQSYPASVCRPTPADGLRVYVPGSTLAKFVPTVRRVAGPRTSRRSSSSRFPTRTTDGRGGHRRGAAATAGAHAAEKKQGIGEAALGCPGYR